MAVSIRTYQNVYNMVVKKGLANADVSTLLTHSRCERSIYYVYTQEVFYMHQVEIQKWGNSAAIRLNKGMLQQISCDIGTKFEAVVQDGGVFLKPIKAPEYSLEMLLETCTKHNTKIDSEDKAWLNTKPVGKEV